MICVFFSSISDQTTPAQEQLVSTPVWHACVCLFHLKKFLSFWSKQHGSHIKENCQTWPAYQPFPFLLKCLFRFLSEYFSDLISLFQLKSKYLGKNNIMVWKIYFGFDWRKIFGSITHLWNGKRGNHSINHGWFASRHC